MTDLPTTTPHPPSQRLHMLDIVRGWCMFFIVGGDTLFLSIAAALGDNAFARGLQRQFTHVQWEGFTLYDGIFPTFLLISGAAFTYSWQKQSALGVSPTRRWLRLGCRTLILIGLGLIYNGILSAHALADIRFPSVLARIGLGVFLAAIPYAYTPQSWRWCVFPLALLLYAALFAGCGGETPYCIVGNWAGAIDTALLPGCIDASGIDGLDPEGIISTLGAAITAYLGMLMADFMRTKTQAKEAWLFSAGVILLGIGYGVSPWIPIIKKLWTSSYVCVAGGWSLLFCALIYLLTDRFRFCRVFAPITFFGTAAIGFYLLPRFFDFPLASWRILGGLSHLLTADPNLHAVFNALGSLLLLWFAIRLCFPRKG